MRHLWWVGLLGCTRAVEPQPLTCEDAEAPTWSTFGQGYVQTWCTPCHTSTLPIEERQGAPSNITLDSHADVLAWSAEILAVSVGEGARMPPLGGVREEDRALFGLWLECGALGEDPAPDPCEGAVPMGNVRIESLDDLAEVCVNEAITVDDLDVNFVDATVDCVCGAEGDITVDGGVARFPALTRAGSLTVTADALGVIAPELTSVTGDVVLDAPGLRAVDLTALDDVGSQLLVQGTELEQLWLMGLQHAGTLSVTDNPALTELRTPRLRTVDQDLRLTNLPALLQGLEETNAVERIGGDLSLTGLGVASFEHWGFSFLQHVGGSVTIADNPNAEDLGGFTLLGDPVAADGLPAGIGGALTIRGNASLRGITGFDTLRTVAGTLDIASNDALEGILGFKNLASVDGDLRLVDNADLDVLTGFRPLEAVGGTLEIGANDRLDGVDGFDQVRSAGAVWLRDNPDLSDLAGLRGLQAITGDVTVTGNPELTVAAIDAWLDSVGRSNVGGTVDVSGNAD